MKVSRLLHRILIVMTIVFIPVMSLHAQLFMVTSNVPDSVLVKNILIGSGVKTSNITYTGAIRARGKFSGSSNIGIGSGVLLTTGDVVLAKGPNSSGSAGYENNLPGDANLTAISGFVTNDACVLEFDFVPQSNSVEFRYVFASEEYHEYAPSNYNDVFGFFISGPNYTYPTNIAILPHTLPPIPVSINTVNNGNTNTGPCDNCQYLVNNTQQSIQYDAFTTVMTAKANVIPCQTYHIKLAVADGVDYRYDSGVFLEANSFSSVGLAVNVNYSIAALDTTCIEGCNNAKMTFKLFQPSPIDFVLPLDISGTAVNGVDYELINDTLVIPAGDSTTELNILALQDGITEPTENIRIIYNSSLCDVILDTLEIYINDYTFPAFHSNVTGNQTIQCQEQVTLSASGNGGIQPYHFQWSTGDTASSITISPPSTTDITVDIGDECGTTFSDTITVTVIGPTAYAGEDAAICMGENTLLTATGGTGYQWSTGQSGASVNVSPVSTTTYWVSVSDDCGNTDVDSVTVWVDTPLANAGADTTICLGQNIDLTASGGVSYAWNTGQNTAIIHVSPVSTTWYYVEVTDHCNNTLADSVLVTVNTGVVANAGPNVTICSGDTATLTATGGLTYAWNTGQAGASIAVSPVLNTTYIVRVTAGCSDSDTVEVHVNPLPVISVTSPAGAICPGDSVTLSVSGALLYHWSAVPADLTLLDDETSANPIIAPLVPTIYSVRATDVNECKTNETVNVMVNELLLPTFSKALATICAGDSVKITYTGNALPTAIYTWNFDGAVASGIGKGPYFLRWSNPGTMHVSLIVGQAGCTSAKMTDSVEVNIKPLPEFASNLPGGCVPLTISFTDNSTSTTPSAIYLWDFGDGQQSLLINPQIVYSQPGTYTVSLKIDNRNGCNNTKNSIGLVRANPVPVANFNANPSVVTMKDPSVAFVDQSVGSPVIFEWQAGDGTTYTVPAFTHRYQDTGIYRAKLNVINEFGCMDTISREIFVHPNYGVIIPTAFTPNNDNLNDRFTIKAKGIEECTINIYDQWGTLIFASANLHTSWDGRIKDREAPAGVYVYYLHYRDILGKENEFHGTFVLVR
jgi:gliding motility-associated-like protein